MAPRERQRIRLEEARARSSTLLSLIDSLTSDTVPTAGELEDLIRRAALVRLSPLAVQAAARLSFGALMHGEAVALLLAGLAPDDVLEDRRSTPPDILDEVLAQEFKASPAAQESSHSRAPKLAAPTCAAGAVRAAEAPVARLDGKPPPAATRVFETPKRVGLSAYSQ